MKQLAVVIVVLMLYPAGSAFAGFTYVNPVGGDGAGTGLFDILDGIYGAGNYTRVDDDFDQWWVETNGGATAIAKYAGYNQSFGYIDPFDNSFNEILNVSSNGIVSGITGTFHMPTHPEFRFADDPSDTRIWTSDPSDNNRRRDQDHMVSFELNNGNYVLCWEDSYRLGDRDYQDLIVEVDHLRTLSNLSTTPVPGAVMLAGIGIGLFGCMRKRKIL